MRGSVNSKIFDTLLYGPGTVKNKGKGKKATTSRYSEVKFF